MYIVIQQQTDGQQQKWNRARDTVSSDSFTETFGQ